MSRLVDFGEKSKNLNPPPPPPAFPVKIKNKVISESLWLSLRKASCHVVRCSMANTQDKELKKASSHSLGETKAFCLVVHEELGSLGSELGNRSS